MTTPVPAPGVTAPLTPYVVPGDALSGWPTGVLAG